MLEISKMNGVGFNKIILEPSNEGVYIFVFETEDSKFPEKDYLEDDTSLAKSLCLERFGTPTDSWNHAPDVERRMA